MLLTAKPFHAPVSTLPPIEIDRTVSCVRPETRNALAYWNDVRGARAMPLRCDIKPAGMRDFIANVALIDVIGGNGDELDFHIRLIGSKIEAVYGPVSRRPIAESVPTHIEKRWRMVFETGRLAGQPVRFAGRVAFADKTWLSGEVLTAPISEDGTAISQLFLVMVTWSALAPGSPP